MFNLTAFALGIDFPQKKKRLKHTFNSQTIWQSSVLNFGVFFNVQG